MSDSNQQPPVYKTGALTIELMKLKKARLPRFELETAVLETVMIPFHHRRKMFLVTLSSH